MSSIISHGSHGKTPLSRRALLRASSGGGRGGPERRRRFKNAFGLHDEDWSKARLQGGEKGANGNFFKIFLVELNEFKCKSEDMTRVREKLLYYKE